MEAPLPGRKESEVRNSAKDAGSDEVAAKELLYQKRIAELTKTVEAQKQRLAELTEENQEYQELRQVYQQQQDIIDRLSAQNQDLQCQVQAAIGSQGHQNYLGAGHAQRDSGVGIDQYEQLAAENEKLKVQLGDMIDKYKILYSKIRELQEERQRERQVEMERQKRAEQSINPFSLASFAAASNGGEQRDEQPAGSQRTEKAEGADRATAGKQEQLHRAGPSGGGPRHQTDAERGENEAVASQRNQSGGSSEESQILASTKADAATRPPKQLPPTAHVKASSGHPSGLQQCDLPSESRDEAGMSMLSHQQSAHKSRRGSGPGSSLPAAEQNILLRKQLKQVTQEKQDQEQELIQAKVEWATLELECDRLRHDMLEYQGRERKLAAEKYEETLKLSILTKQNEIAGKIKQKQQEVTKLTPQIKKLGKLFSFTNNVKIDGKKSKDQGCHAACGDSFDNHPISSQHSSTARAPEERTSHPSHSAAGSAKGYVSTGIGGSQAASSKRSDNRIASSRY